MKQVFDHIDSHRQQTLDDLGRLVSFRSESADLKWRAEGMKTAKWFEKYLSGLGAKVKLCDAGETVYDEVARVKNNPIVYASFNSGRSKRTLLFYGHYDVQPAVDLSEWKTDPWKMSGPDKSGFVYGRGVVDDKGEVLSVLKAIEAYRRTNTPLPVNIKIILEGMEEFGSAGLEEFVRREKRKLLRDVDTVLICDTEWLGMNVPSVTHSLRGVNYFEVSVSGPKGDLHSGYYGGPVWEPLSDLVTLFSRLRKGSMGKVRIPKFYKNVIRTTWKYRRDLKRSSFDVDEYKRQIGVNGLAVPEKANDVILATTLEPTLSIHGIGKVADCKTFQTIIPAKTVGHFSTRLVPFQDPKFLVKQTVDFLKKEFARLKSPNKLVVKVIASANWWYKDPSDKAFECASQAVTEGFAKGKAVMAGGGCSVPITFVFEKELGVTPVLIPLGKPASGAHGPNERHHVDCLIDGSKVVVRYLESLAEL